MVTVGLFCYCSLNLRLRGYADVNETDEKKQHGQKKNYYTIILVAFYVQNNYLFKKSAYNMC